MNNENDYKERLLLLIKSLNSNKMKFAHSIGVTPSNVTDWLGNIKNSRPSMQALLRISEIHGVSIDWLLTGKGEMFLNKVEKGYNTTSGGNDTEKVRKLEDQIEELKKTISDLEKDNDNLDAQLSERLNELLDCQRLLIKLQMSKV